MNSTDSVNAFHVRVDNALNDTLNNTPCASERLREAMTYSLFSGGKRLRPILVYFMGELLDVPEAPLDWMAASVELIHGYSLIHDDLPAMDDDDFRRGRLSCHKAFDEATAILAGDALQSLAFEILLTELPKTLPSEAVVHLCRILASAIGASGMAGGQALDLTALHHLAVDEHILQTTHQLKTGQLILACANMCIAASPIDDTSPKAHALRAYASTLGLAFQMQDDYLDAYHKASHGKGRASDEANGKATYAHRYTKAELFARVHHEYQKACDHLLVFGDPAKSFIHFTQQLCLRSQG